MYPTVDSVHSSLQLDKLADRVRELVAKPMDPRQMCLVINRVLFHEFGYRGAGKNFEDPDNSFLHCVLEQKKRTAHYLVSNLLTCREKGRF